MKISNGRLGKDYESHKMEFKIESRSRSNHRKPGNLEYNQSLAGLAKTLSLGIH